MLTRTQSAATVATWMPVSQDGSWRVWFQCLTSRAIPTQRARVIRSLRSLLFFLIVGLVPASAQDPGTLYPEPLPPLSNPNSRSIPAKELFARKTMPLLGVPRSIGSYADGCLAGAVALPISGPIWQVMRLSRNRYWGNPSLVAFIKRLADHAKEVGWNGLLVGDMSQPRGGPMLSGHSSHQIGLMSISGSHRRQTTSFRRRNENSIWL